MLLALGGVAEAQSDRCAFARLQAVMNALAEKLLIAQRAALGAQGPRAVEGKLNGVQDGRFAAAVDAAQEDDRRVFAASPRRREIKGLLAAIEAVIRESELLENHLWSA